MGLCRREAVHERGRVVQCRGRTGKNNNRSGSCRAELKFIIFVKICVQGWGRVAQCSDILGKCGIGDMCRIKRRQVSPEAVQHTR